MCSQFWTIEFTVPCPVCHQTQIFQAQTHAFGEIGSCTNYYKTGDLVEELVGNPEDVLQIDDFVVTCKACNTWLMAGAVFENGRFMGIYEFGIDKGIGDADKWDEGSDDGE